MYHQSINALWEFRVSRKHFLKPVDVSPPTRGIKCTVEIQAEMLVPIGIQAGTKDLTELINLGIANERG